MKYVYYINTCYEIMLTARIVCLLAGCIEFWVVDSFDWYIRYFNTPNKNVYYIKIKDATVIEWLSLVNSFDWFIENLYIQSKCSLHLYLGCTSDRLVIIGP